MTMQDVGIIVLYLFTMGMVLSMVAVGLGVVFAVGYAFDSILTKWGF